MLPSPFTGYDLFTLRAQLEAAYSLTRAVPATQGNFAQGFPLPGRRVVEEWSLANRRFTSPCLPVSSW